MSFRGSGRVAAGRLRWPPSPGLPGPQSRWLTPERAHAHHRLHLRSHRHRGDHRCRDAHSQDATARTVRGFALRKMRLPSVIQGLTKAPPGVISKKGAKTAAAAQLGAAVSASEKRGDARGFVGGARGRSSSTSGPAGITPHRRDGPQAVLARPPFPSNLDQGKWPAAHGSRRTARQRACGKAFLFNGPIELVPRDQASNAIGLDAGIPLAGLSSHEVAVW
jgi:hypothetical protein